MLNERGESPGEVTELDHEAGFKELEVELRSGWMEMVKFTAPSHRQAEMLFTTWAREGDAESIVDACLPREMRGFVNKLTLVSGTRVKMVCLELAFGAEVLKKSLQVGHQYLEVLRRVHGASTKPC